MKVDTTNLQAAGAVRVTGAQTEKIRFLRGHPVEEFYPAAARSEGLDAIVVVDLLINDLGLVVEAEVLSESPAGKGFGLAALDAVKTYEFENPLKKLVLMSMTIRFVP